MFNVIDVSRWQGLFDWALAGKAGYAGGIIKATDGLREDSTFAAHRAGIRQAAMWPGYYHFMEPDKDAKEQAMNLCKTVGAVMPTDIGVDLDCEWTKDGTAIERWQSMADPNERQDFILTVAQVVVAQLHCKVLIYTSADFVAEMLPKNHVLGQFDLHVCDYNKLSVALGKPRMPQGWTDWRIWQTGQKEVPGISGAVDVNLMKETV